MLVIHNDLDFRCPIGQGHELFTSLQRQGVPPVHQLPRRGALGAEADEQPVLAQGGVCLAEEVCAAGREMSVW